MEGDKIQWKDESGEWKDALAQNKLSTVRQAHCIAFSFLLLTFSSIKGKL